MTCIGRMPTPVEKFNGPERTSTAMTELISWADMESPAPSYPGSFQAWRDTTEDVIQEVVAASEIEETYDTDVCFMALEKFLARAKCVSWTSQPPEVRAAQAKEILERPQIPQRTEAWYAQGKQVLTASEFAKLFGTPRCVSQLVMSKVPVSVSTSTNRLACMTCEMGPFDWGVRFEPVVKQILEAKWGVKIAEAGRIIHPTDCHVAASPDGIFLEATDPARVGRLVEIKCPITRKVGEGIPFEYWCQMQVQMEVTGVGECEYVEVKLDSLQKSQTDLSGAEGHLWLLQNPATCEMRYVYNEADILEGWDITEKIPWKVNEMYTVTVTRDRGWYQGTEELRREFWKNVEEARKGAFKAVEGRQKVIVTKENECLIVD